MVGFRLKSSEISDYQSVVLCFQFLFDKIDKFRKCRIHEMSSVVIFVKLGLQTVGNTFLREFIFLK